MFGSLSSLVHNKYRKTAPPGAVYIGRGGPWGNQFKIGKDGTREEVIEKYRLYLEANPVLKARVKAELRGKHVVCFCSPKPCHGDVLVRVANEE